MLTTPTRSRTASARAFASAKRILTLLSVASLLAVVVGTATTLAAPTPAEAAAKVSVSGTPNPDGESTLDLSGSGFQSVQNGFGGIYVLFGWVDDKWRPSQGGATGTNYRYVYDDETNPTGYQVFVTFPGSSTASAANGGEVAADGTWKARIKVPGATFTTYDRSQNETQIDCTKVQCGIITIGAHGVANANNESFTPVEFAAAGAGAEAEKKDEQASGGEGEQAEPAEETKTQAPAAAAGQADPTVANPAVAPVSTQPLLSQSWTIFFAILAAVAVIGVIIAVGLGFGIGGYLAVKSLLLGVSPAALEKERNRREKKRLRVRNRLERRRITMQKRKQLRLAKLERGSEKALAHASHHSAEANTGKLSPHVIAFFDQEDRRLSGSGAGGEGADSTLASGDALASGDGSTWPLSDAGRSADDGSSADAATTGSDAGGSAAGGSSAARRSADAEEVTATRVLTRVAGDEQEGDR